VQLPSFPLISMATNPLPPSDADGPDSPDRMRAFAKYSGIAFQMLATIGLSAWAGTWLDGHFQNKNPWWTIGLMLFGVLAALYQVIRGLTKGS
jgi:ATP synthase protein I